jgi:3-dehydroquinate dehydratase-1
MENLLCIKGKIIGKGKPLVCVPVMESSKEEILRETRRLEEAHTEMIEWRVDAFENVESPNAIREILNEMKHIIKESILVYTFRSKNQGGCKALSAADIYDIHQVAAESDVVDFIDVEYFEANSEVAGDGSICDCFPS